MIDCTRLKTFSAWLPMLVLAASLACPCAARAEDAAWRVGLARARITPERPMPICGYGPRMSQGVLDDLYAKALGGKSIIIAVQSNVKNWKQQPGSGNFATFFGTHWEYANHGGLGMKITHSPNLPGGFKYTVYIVVPRP